MIISKKKFDEEIAKAVKIALDKKEEEIKRYDFEMHIERRIDSQSNDFFSAIADINKRIYDIEENLRRSIEELNCKISHKRKTLNG